MSDWRDRHAADPISVADLRYVTYTDHGALDPAQCVL